MENASSGGVQATATAAERPERDGARQASDPALVRAGFLLGGVGAFVLTFGLLHLAFLKLVASDVVTFVEDVSDQCDGTNADLVVSRTPMLAGSGDEVAVAERAWQVTVKVDGEQAEVAEIDGEEGRVTLSQAPRAGAEVTVRYSVEAYGPIAEARDEDLAPQLEADPHRREFHLAHGRLVKGEDEETPASEPGDVTVKVDGATIRAGSPDDEATDELRVVAIDPEAGTITLNRAPDAGSEIKADYHYGDRSQKWLVWLPIAGGLAAIALAIGLSFTSFVAFLTERHTIIFGLVGLASALAFGILVGVNYLAHKHALRADWTRAELYSVSDHTTRVVRGLGDDVMIHIYVFGYRGVPQLDTIKELIDRYKALSSRIDVEYVDPDSQRERFQDLVLRLEIQRPDQSMIVFEEEESRRKHHVTFDELFETSGGPPGASGGDRGFKGEQAFTQAILNVTTERKRVVRFLTGHEERSIFDQDRNGYALVRTVLEQQNYRVETLELEGQTPAVPEETDVLVIAGARRDLDPAERQAISAYLERGGRAFILLDPIQSPRARTDPERGPVRGVGIAPPPLASLLASWNVSVDRAMLAQEGIIEERGRDESRQMRRLIPMVVAPDLPEHAVTAPLRALRASLRLWEAMPVKAETTDPDHRATVIARTHSRVLGFRELNQEAMLEEDIVDGPHDVAVVSVPSGQSDDDEEAGAGEDDEGDGADAANRARLIVIGDSDFAKNEYIYQPDEYRNMEFFLNCVHWLAERHAEISFEAKRPPSYALRGMEEDKVWFFGLLAAGDLPIACLYLGLVVWLLRRR